MAVKCFTNLRPQQSQGLGKMFIHIK